MPRHLYILFIATFIFGAVVGGITYLMVHTGEGGGDTVLPDTNGIEITARMNGSCNTTERTLCPQYRIKNDGTYTYRYFDDAGNPKQRDGEVSISDMAYLRHSIQMRTAHTYPPSSGSCSPTLGSPTFTYDILSDGESYSFDSCKQNLEGDAFFDTLKNYFATFSKAHDNV